MRRAVALLALIACLAAGACDTDFEPLPADSYESIEQLASTLGSAGLCDDFRKFNRDLPFDFGQCRPTGARPGSDFTLLSWFPTNRVRDRQMRREVNGCGGTYVYGPNWAIGPLTRQQIQPVRDVVGGEIVGLTETVDC